MLTKERLCEVLKYNKEDGCFTWIKTKKRVKAGQVAGRLNQKGYRQIVIDGNYYMAHRLAWLYMHGHFPAFHIDHINGVKDDNRFSNLREASSAENNRNVRISSRNTSGVKGVSFSKDIGKWKAYCHDGEVNVHLGYFSEIRDAERMVREYRVKFHGEFANHG